MATMAVDAAFSQVPDWPVPLVIAHRGASGYLPEHTLAAYALAISQGADVIEPDLVSTRDGVLIARHEPNLTETTDVANRPDFAARRTTKVIDGQSQTGWFADDFTLAEIKTLRARQRLAFRPQQFNEAYDVPTFAEVLALAQRESTRTRRTVGVYPETKHPTYHRSRGLALEEKVVEALEEVGWNRTTAPVFIQSFEVASLRRLRGLTPVRLVQLIDALGAPPDPSVSPDHHAPYDLVVSGDPRTYADLITPAGLADIATYANGVGLAKGYIVRHDTGRSTGVASDLVERAHAAGLFVHAWTFRNETRFLGAADGGDAVQEYLRFYCRGVDGVFSDFPDTAVAARELLRAAPGRCGGAGA